MITVFALCTAGGLALTARVPSLTDPSRAMTVTTVLLGLAVVLALISFFAAVLTAGWERTIDYALQRIERDGVMSTGGNWNQFQLSKIPIALGAIGVSSSLTTFVTDCDSRGTLA
jgi:hypothetical protein